MYERRQTMLVPDPGDVRNAVVFYTRGLGDHVIALPAMRALGRLFPGKLSLVVSRSAPDLFFGDVGFARIFSVEMDFKREKGSLYDVPSVAARLGAHELFLAVIPGGGDEWAELERRLQPRWTVGFAKGFRALLIEDLVNSHSVDEPFRLPRLFDSSLRPEDFAHPFPLPPASVEFVTAMRQALGGRRLLVIHGETKPYKQWPADRFRAALAAFFNAHPHYVGVEIGRLSSVLGAPPPRHLRPLTGLPFASSIALAASADLLLCVDSLFLHVADLWRTPTVALFGPTSPEVWGARFNPMCRYARGAGSMEALTVDAVLEALAAGAAEIERIGYSPRPLLATGAPDLVCWQ
jgi:ADP-heptose:LPS heptosyltransferase